MFDTLMCFLLRTAMVGCILASIISLCFVKKKLNDSFHYELLKSLFNHVGFSFGTCSQNHVGIIWDSSYLSDTYSNYKLRKT